MFKRIYWCGSCFADINYLPFLPLGVTVGVYTTSLPQLLDGSSDEIPITEMFPFGTVNQTSVYVSQILAVYSAAGV